VNRAPEWLEISIIIRLNKLAGLEVVVVDISQRAIDHPTKWKRLIGFHDGQVAGAFQSLQHSDRYR